MADKTSGSRAALPVAAEMFGSDYEPCGDQPNTIAIVECVEAKPKVWDRRLNKAYKELPQRLDAGRLEPLKEAQRLWIKYRAANCGFYGSGEGPSGKFRPLNACAR